MVAALVDVSSSHAIPADNSKGSEGLRDCVCARACVHACVCVPECLGAHVRLCGCRENEG